MEECCSSVGDSIIKAKLASFSTLRLPCMPARDIEVRLWVWGRSAVLFIPCMLCLETPVAAVACTLYFT